MAGADNLIGKGFENRPDDINKAGRPKGSRNRNAVAKEILSMVVTVPEKMLEKLRGYYPELSDKQTIEQLGTLSVAMKAIKRGDHNAFKTIMDNAYGAPIQEIDVTSEGERINPVVQIITTGIPLSSSEKDVQM